MNMNYHKLDLEKLENSKPESPDTVPAPERREFLKIGLAITGVFAGGKIFSATSVVDKAYASGSEFAEKYPYKPHYSMVIRTGLCVDCERCIEACTTTNHVPSYGYRTRIYERTMEEAVGQKHEFIPILCNHCNEPPCVRGCPTKATYKNPENGIVMMDDKKCAGCKTCMVACPYNARYFNDEKRAVDKCNFCYDTRLSKGEKLTACANACPTGARTFGDISDPNNVVYKMVHQLERHVWVLRPETGVKPNVFYMKR
jgi:protein NrfC